MSTWPTYSTLMEQRQQQADNACEARERADLRLEYATPLTSEQLAAMPKQLAPMTHEEAKADYAKWPAKVLRNEKSYRY